MRTMAQEACASAKLDDQEVESYRQYLRLVMHCQATNSAASGALFLQVVEGQLQYVAVDNLNDVFLGPREIIRMAERIEQERIQERMRIRPDMEAENELRIKQHGPGYRMGVDE